MASALRRIGRPWFITLLVAGSYLLVLLLFADGDPLVLVQMGTRFSQSNPDGSIGYDGQFYYYIAREPQQAWRYVDIPAYRYQRIFYPVLAHLLSLGNEQILPWSMLGINLASLAGSVAVVETLLVEQRVSRWFALSVGLCGGMLFSVMGVLTEPLALWLALAAMLLFARGRRMWSACFFALSVLTKETMLIVVAGYLVYLVTQRQLGSFLIMGAWVGVPFALWQIVLLAWLGDLGVGSGGAGATPFHIVPFGALVSLVRGGGWPVFWVFASVLVPLAVVPTVWAILATGRDILRREYHPWAFALAFFALVIPFLPASTFLDLSAMPRYTTPLVALMVLYAAHRRSRRVLAACLLWVTTIVLVPSF